ncbi:hypothetical protein EXU57_09225 [Segetibacter sp. 3557_3]|nr:hypothetical protein EXU57_09225 [Segetibacter sp. 3557_3]
MVYNLAFDHKPAAGNFGFRIVAGSNFGRYLNAKTIGGGVYYLAGKQDRFLELGADLQYLVVNENSDDQRGFSFVYPNFSVKTLYTSLNIGYRYYRKQSMFRIGLSPGLLAGKPIPGGYICYGIRL